MPSEPIEETGERVSANPEVTPFACAFLCRAGFEPALVAELAARGISAPPDAAVTTAGLVTVQSLLGADGARVLGAPYIFERQRMTNVLRFSNSGLKPLAREIVRHLLRGVVRSQHAWTVHAFGAGPNDGGTATGRAKRLEDVFLSMCRARFSAVARRYVPAPEAAARGAETLVVQLCMTGGGLLGCVMKLRELADSHPGGIHRMRFDPLAPSRSYLKIEEAFGLMGEQPSRGQRVVDLGAAPGGWTYAFLKRGCTVTAVDRAELRLKSVGETDGRVRHLRADGITYVPPPKLLPVDWLVSDMLQPVGQNIGMIRKWMDNRWMRRFVFNVKLPQGEPLAALRPLEKYLASVRGSRFTIRQLYHDREEVTVCGHLSSQAN